MLACLLPAGSRAGGFDIPGVGSRGMGRGSAFVVLADDLSGLLLNPGGLSRQKGTFLLLNHDLMWHHATFTRAASIMENLYATDPDYPTWDPLEPVENEVPLFPLGAMLALGSDFGLDDWTFALHVSGPNAIGHVKYPVDGGGRYMLTEMDIILVYYTAAASWGKRDSFGLGLALTYVQLPRSNFTMVVDATNHPDNTYPYYSPMDQIAAIEMADHTSFTATLGGWWRPIPQLELGASARVVPIMLHPEGDLSLSTPAGQKVPDIPIEDGSASLELTLPFIARLGARYRHLGSGDREVFDVELDFVYEAWSSIEDYHIDLSGIAYPPGDAYEIQDLVIEKRWKDTFSVRLGGSWNILADTLTWSLGGFFESAAVPEAYSNLDVTSFERFGLGTGVRVSFYGVDLSISYMHIFQGDRNVDEEHAKVFQARPLRPCLGTPETCDGLDGVPANAGRFETSYDQLNMSLAMHFDRW